MVCAMHTGKRSIDRRYDLLALGISPVLRPQGVRLLGLGICPRGRLSSHAMSASRSSDQTPAEAQRWQCAS